MLGLDDQIAGLSDGGGLLLALAVAVLLGLRHASDPDHLTAVTTLILSGDRRGAPRAGSLGLAWGAGHAVTLSPLGFPWCSPVGCCPTPSSAPRSSRSVS